MKLRDIFALGVKGIAERKFRTMLTVLSIMIGIAAIVALISLVSGISASIAHSLEATGPTTLYVAGFGSHILTDVDVAEIESLPYVANVTPVVSFSANLSEAGTQTTITVYGVNNYSIAGTLGSVDLYSGSVYNDTSVPYALVGYDVAFPTTTQTSPSVSLNQPMYLTVHSQSGSKSLTLIPVGILNKYGSASFVSPDSSVFVPMSVAESVLGKYSYSMLIVKATNASTVGSLDTLLSNIYGNSARVISVQEIASTVASITGSLAILLSAIAGISLLVAGISILSIMMISVNERTHEIGILKSIGFRRNDVMLLFLSEAVLIGLIGGIVGVSVGIGGAYALPALLGGGSHQSASPSAGQSAFGSGGGSAGRGSQFVAVGTGSPQRTSNPASSGSSSISISPQISPVVIIIAILISIVVSVLSSMYPAWKASTIDPIKALRSE